MPLSNNTIIPDLAKVGVKGVRGGGFVSAASGFTEIDLNPAMRVKYKYKPVKITPKDDTPSHFWVESSSLIDADGRQLDFQDEWNTVAPLDRKRPIVVGGGYSGCLYSVYHVGSGNFMCVHSARPDGKDSETYVQGLQLYAETKRWALVHAVSTRKDALGGAGINGCVTTYLATRVDYNITPNPVIRTIRLRQDGQGNTVDFTRFADLMP